MPDHGKVRADRVQALGTDDAVWALDSSIGPRAIELVRGNFLLDEASQVANYFISAHGSQGDIDGEFVVPVGTTIYFFSPTNSLLESRYSDFFKAQLCTDRVTPSAEAYVRAMSVEVAPEGELVPNHIAMGSKRNSRRDPTGIYMVGRPSVNGPVFRLLDGVKRTLKDLVSGISDGGSIGTHLYWGVSRENKGIPVGFSPTQYFDIVGMKSKQTAKSVRASRFRGSQHYAPGTEAMVVERPETRLDCSDYTKLREFKAKLQSGSGVFGFKRA